MISPRDAGLQENRDLSARFREFQATEAEAVAARLVLEAERDRALLEIEASRSLVSFGTMQHCSSEPLQQYSVQRLQCIPVSLEHTVQTTCRPTSWAVMS